MTPIVRRILLLSLPMILLSGQARRINAQTVEKEAAERLSFYTLDQCVEMALERHVKRQIARESVRIAEAQKKQVLSSYWPQLSASALYSVTDEEPTFIFPESTIKLPAAFSQIMSALLGMEIDLPAMPVPEQRVKLMDTQNLAASVKLTLPLYTGGIRSALKEQAALGIQIARNDILKTRNEIVRDVKKYYYAVILTNHLLDIGQEALDRLQATLDLTESLYKTGSGRVKKTDYLKNKLIVDNVRMLVSDLQKNSQMAQAALKFSIGLPWNEPIGLAADAIPYEAMDLDLDSYIHRMLSENPELQQARLATRIFDLKVKEIKGYRYPHVGLVGQYTRLFNRYNDGIMTPENKQIWMAGVGISYSFFNGFRFRNKIQEEIGQARRMHHQYSLFQKGLTLMVQSHFHQLTAAQAGVDIARDAYATASENLDLVKRAYQIELLTEKDLIEAQIFEALMKARLEKSFYDHLQIRTDLETLLADQMTDFIRRRTFEDH